MVGFPIYVENWGEKFDMKVGVSQRFEGAIRIPRVMKFVCYLHFPHFNGSS